MSARAAVFLDRDGVINRNVPDPATGEFGAPRTAAEFAMAPGAIEGLAALRDAGFALFLISNQPNYAKGKSTLEDLAAIHRKLEAELEAAGVVFVDFYYCYHSPQGDVPGYSMVCECRKPSPYFLFKARDDHGAALGSSWMVGDRATDIECGQAAGLRTIRVAEDHPAVRKPNEARADYEVADLRAAATIILEAAKAGTRNRPATAILAGGRATRLGEITERLPKSLLQVAGEPFLAHQLRLLARQEFRDVVLCVGHLGGLIEDFAGDGSAFGCRVRYSFEGPRALGTGGALRRALPLLGDGFLVLYGDSYLRAPLLPVWERFAASGKAALMTVFRNDGQWDRSNIEFRDGEIRSYDKSAPTSAMRHIDYGLGCVRAEALSAFAGEGDAFDLADFYRAMLERGQLAAFEVADRFYEIGSPSGLAETKTMLGATRRGRDE